MPSFFEVVGPNSCHTCTGPWKSFSWLSFLLSKVGVGLKLNTFRVQWRHAHFVRNGDTLLAESIVILNDDTLKRVPFPPSDLCVCGVVAMCLYKISNFVETPLASTP